MRDRGFTLMELMISMTLGLLLLGGLVALLVSSGASRKHMEQGSLLLESGRYGMDVLVEDLRMAGFFGDFDPADLNLLSSLTPADGSDPTGGACAGNLSDSAALSRLRYAMLVPVFGSAGGTGSWCAVANVTQVGTQSDVLIVRRASTCVSGDANCTMDTTNDVFLQTSLCNTDSTSGATYPLDRGTGALTLLQKDCTTTADIRKFIAHAYLVGTTSTIVNNQAQQVPTLFRMELNSGQWQAVPLAVGVELIAVEYGVDSSSADGAPDVWTQTVSSLTGCTNDNPLGCWNNVVAVRVALLARAVDPDPGYTDTKTYTLSSVPGVRTFTPGTGDNYRRHLYTVTVRIENVSGRRAP
ncbi:MAG: putative type 4 fimbrial biosis PilW-related protein transrane [Magnetococcales bacterium]|nr:putative type 4 fimbrial biosis PilW-related protein transrane [Magnetococcales bacterium]